MTPVIFRRDKGSREIVAVFPTIPAEVHRGVQLFSCYRHIGQHGACTREWYVTRTYAASPSEYLELFLELRQFYSDLVVYRRWARFPEGYDQ